MKNDTADKFLDAIIYNSSIQISKFVCKRLYIIIETKSG